MGLAAVIITIFLAFCVVYVVYMIPYWWWFSEQRLTDALRKEQKVGMFRNIRNATKVYFSWITHKEPTF